MLAATSVRDRIAAIDAAFTDRMDKLVVAPAYDFQFALNKYAPPASGKVFEFTKDHYGTLNRIIERSAAPRRASSSIIDLDRGGTSINRPKCRHRSNQRSSNFALIPQTGKGWVVVYLLMFKQNSREARFGWHCLIERQDQIAVFDLDVLGRKRSHGRRASIRIRSITTSTQTRTNRSCGR